MGLQFTAKQGQLLRELAMAVGAVEKKTTIPILGNVLLRASGGDALTIEATDLELSYTATIPAAVQGLGEITLPARKVADYVKLLPPTEEVTFKEGASSWVTLTCGKSKSRIAGMSVESWPTLPQIPDGGFSVRKADLVRLIKQTSYAISMEESRFTLNGALLLAWNGKLQLMATDSHRLAVAGVESLHLEETVRVLCPRKALVEAAKAFDGAAGDETVTIATDDNNVYLDGGSRRIICRRLTGNFPDVERVIPRNHPGHAIVNRQGLLSALARVRSFADERSRSVRWQIVGGVLTISAATADHGESEESIDLAGGAGDVEIQFNSNYVTDTLQSFNAETVEFRFKSGGEAAMFSSGADSFCVVMPQRI